MSVRAEISRTRASLSDSFWGDWDPDFIAKAAEKMSELCEKYNGIPSKTTISEDGLISTKVYIFPDGTDLEAVKTEWESVMGETTAEREWRESEKANGKTQVTFFE